MECLTVMPSKQRSRVSDTCGHYAQWAIIPRSAHIFLSHANSSWSLQSAQCNTGLCDYQFYLFIVIYFIIKTFVYISRHPFNTKLSFQFKYIYINPDEVPNILITWKVRCINDSSYIVIYEKKLRGLSPQANYTDRATAAVGEVMPTFAGRGCYVVSSTDSHGR
jgi:hypothetical protein